MNGRVLHILSQRPDLTGSGVTLAALVEQAGGAGWRQAVVIGVPADEPVPAVGGLPPAAIHPVRFADGPQTAQPDAAPADLDFPLPGMSDVMPYRSSVWSRLTEADLDAYRGVWRAHLARIVASFRPDVIHSHHVWLVSALLKDVAPDVPVATTCHSTGLRQLELAPRLAAEVRRGCARIDHFCVLHEDHRQALCDHLRIGADRVTVVGAGYRPEVFRPGAGPDGRAGELLYVGKYSRAKGLPWLLDAFCGLRRRRPGLRLHIAGGGSGPEADRIGRRLQDLAPAVVAHGQLAQSELADLMRRCGVCVLPSFYEGLPLVLVEAAACGCRLVATALPGVREDLAPHLGPWLTQVPLPRLERVDSPVAADLPGFVRNLESALTAAVDRAAADGAGPGPDLARFTWEAVFGRVAGVWRRIVV